MPGICGCTIVGERVVLLVYQVVHTLALIPVVDQRDLRTYDTTLSEDSDSYWAIVSRAQSDRMTKHRGLEDLPSNSSVWSSGRCKFKFQVGYCSTSLTVVAIVNHGSDSRHGSDSGGQEAQGLRPRWQLVDKIIDRPAGPVRSVRK